ncbi:melatonin receptor type 1B-B-like [Ptychodera flava]|uniref:melatonin receptor type 1B-B-like n=1 Tax=Ptychodera flava TaxID=63121 RepID=UPI00396AAFE3
MAFEKLNDTMNRTNTTLNKHHVLATDLLPAHWITQLCGSLELLFAVGTLVGNIMFILIVIFKKKLRTWMNLFLVNLSLTDIISALFISLPTMHSYYHRVWRLGSLYCLIHNLLHPIMISTSLWLTAFISINRYIYIVHNNMYQRLTNGITITLAIIFAWSAPIVSQYTVYKDTSLSSYDPTAFRCLIPGTKLFFISLVYTPSFLVILWYILIIAHVLKSRCRVQAHAFTQPQSSTVTVATPQELRMLLVVFGIFCLVLLGYLPVAFIIFIAKLQDRRPPIEGFILSYPLIHIGGVMNPFLYGVNNRHFKEAYKDLLTGKLIRCSKLSTTNQVVPATHTGQTSSTNQGHISVSLTNSVV